MQIGIGIGLTNGGGGGWSPARLGSSLLGYWDAENAGSLTLSGASVTTWTDVVGSYAATQATAGSKPTYSATSFNGRPGITFDGTDDELTLASVPFPTGATPSEIWALVDQQALPADTGVRRFVQYGGASAASSRVLLRMVSVGVNRLAASADNAGVFAQAIQGTVDLSGRHVARGVYTGAVVRAVTDGTASTDTTAVSTTSAIRFRIGADTAGTAANFGQFVANTILVTSLLSATDAAALLAYLKTRGGIA